jgi:hypothetical protein
MRFTTMLKTRMTTAEIQTPGRCGLRSQAPAQNAMAGRKKMYHRTQNIGWDQSGFKTT